jgi:predicted NUDIX family NTP pyrophosphohydrolase
MLSGMPRISAGILLFRRRGGSVEVLLAHPGGPFFAGRDEGSWGIPKGLVEVDEELEDVARREFEEETGSAAPRGRAIPLGTITQKAGKVVHAWALEGDLDPAAANSNTFPLEWPPHSGLWTDVPEIDRVEWFEPVEARLKLKDAQVPFVDRLLEALAG